MVSLPAGILIVIATFFLMEGVAWFTHKYVMHGFLWSWHASHHKVHKQVLEKNDLFALVFSFPAILTIIVGSTFQEINFLFFMGIGITAYGIFYLLFHDILVHRRIKIKIVAKSRYLRRIMNAHYIHHKIHTKHGAESFGFLFAPKKYELKD